MMTKEEIFAKAEGLLEFGIEREPVTEKWKRVNEERSFWQNPVHAVAALNNGDLDHALLALLREYPDKVLKGLDIAAAAVDADAVDAGSFDAVSVPQPSSPKKPSCTARCSRNSRRCSATRSTSGVPITKLAVPTGLLP